MIFFLLKGRSRRIDISADAPSPDFLANQLQSKSSLLIFQNTSPTSFSPFFPPLSLSLSTLSHTYIKVSIQSRSLHIYGQRSCSSANPHHHHILHLSSFEISVASPQKVLRMARERAETNRVAVVIVVAFPGHRRPAEAARFIFSRTSLLTIYFWSPAAFYQYAF